MQSLSGPKRTGPDILLFDRHVQRELVDAWRDKLAGWKDGLEGGIPLNHGEVYRVDGEVGSLVFKRSLEKGWKACTMLLGLREAPLMRAYQLGREASGLGLHTPRPLAYFQRRRAAGFETMLITDYAEGQNPWTYVWENPRELPRVLDVLGAEIASWHARGFRHRDLKGPNLLYEPACGQVQVLDLVGARRESPVPPLSIRGHDLGRLKVSALSSGLKEADWMCLLDRYFHHSSRLGIPVRRPQPFIQAVTNRASRKLRRNQLSSRPIA